MAEENDQSDYVGTENSKYGKIVVARSLRRDEVEMLEATVPDGHQLTWHAYHKVLDEGPEDKGFASQKAALDRIQEIAMAELEGKTWDELPGRSIPDYFVLRVSATVRPRPVQKVELEFDM